MKAPARVTVLGAGLSGRAAAALAKRKGAQVTLTDLNAQAPEMDGIRCIFGRHEDTDLTDTDLVVVSPGIPAAAPPVRLAQDADVAVVGELGFAASFLPQDKPILAISGTNGKSTVTWFTKQILEQAGMKVFAGGNLGTPLSLAVDGDHEVLVVEVSSYQMELPGPFTPWAAVILNLTPDHLARHGDMATYAQHKLRLFDNLRPEGLAGLVHEPHLEFAAQGKPGRRIWLDRLALDNPVLDTLRVLGDHNRWNAAVACLLAAEVGVVPADLSTLVGLPHRLEPVPSNDGRRWINDSKATNIEAAIVGISAMEGPGVVLLGGRGKAGADYSRLRACIEGRPVVCFGEAGPEIHAALGGTLVGSLDQAVSTARELSAHGEQILLSPACSSFDAFQNFERRGDHFRALVQELP
ncbi:MAG: UDP-N-acetylmuramoyl-L-alanine--D-glutamate ligase [Myxococcota bacterium]|nr:UDP-N-acetylmuramoyl-L-alanine--D-glutamate ligase [Myxococcota bacterium]